MNSKSVLDFPASGHFGISLLHDPTLNKGTAFTEEERDALGLRGLLPPRVHTQEEQIQRVLENIRGKATDLERYIFMIGLAGSQRNAFLPAGARSLGRDDAGHLYADGRPCLPKVRAHLSPAEGNFRLNERCRPHCESLGELADQECVA